MAMNGAPGRLALATAALALVAGAAPADARDVPALTGPVVDEAGLLGPAERRQLESLCRAAWDTSDEHRVQLQYLIVKSLGGEDVEGFAVRVFEAWKLGEKGKDNGVLVVVSRDDRKVRIETGYGNEGGLTDAQSGRIIRNVIAPAFREGRYGDGLAQAGVQILTALGAPRAPVRRRSAQPPNGLHGLGTMALVSLLMLFVVGRMFLSGFGPRRRRWYGGWGGPFGGGWGGGAWGGGGWGGGGGGGWGGGGGRSGGGGASGGW
jgi:uncharacterized protein